MVAMSRRRQTFAKGDALRDNTYVLLDTKD